MIRFKVSLVIPGGPSDPGQFVGERTGRLVVAGASLEVDDPLLKPVQRLTCRVHLLGSGQD